MKKGLYIIAFLALTCNVFTSCKKRFDELYSKEDLSYVIRTYYRYESNGKIIKQTWTYDGYKVSGYKYYIDGLLYSERKDYLYDRLNVSYNSYSYRNGDVNDLSVQHTECEYLDDTYQRIKYQKSYIPDTQNTNILETYYEYDGKKRLCSKSYTNGVLTNEIHYNYDGLRCTYKTTDYYYDDVVRMERNYEILYLDETCLREKTRLQTRKKYDIEGNLISTDTYYTVNEYDGKKPIGYQWYHNGKLGSVGRDYQYDGLNCYYFVDDYQDGEVISTRMYEVEYLE